MQIRIGRNSTEIIISYYPEVYIAKKKSIGNQTNCLVIFNEIVNQTYLYSGYNWKLGNIAKSI